MNPWIVLVAAGLFEIGWPIGLKLGGGTGLWRVAGPAMAVACMSTSGALLWLALKQIPIDTAYAVWTGVGAVGTFVVGVISLATPHLLCAGPASR